MTFEIGGPASEAYEIIPPMKRFRSIIVSAVFTMVAFLLLTPNATPAEFKLPKAKDRWIEVTTANFTVFSNAGEIKTKAAVTNLERLRTVLGTLFGGTKLTSPVPTYIFVFDSPKTFAPYTLYYEGRGKEVGGYFSPGRLANHVAILGNRNSTEISSTIYHEYLHYVMSTNQAELPLWLNEGLAELYSTFEMEDGLAKIGYPIGNHITWLRSHQIIPLAELMAIDRDSPEYNEGHRRGVFYAQSWALTHMLIMDSDGNNRATRYTQLTRQGVGQDEAFQQALGGTYKEIEKELNHYVRGRSFSYSKIPVSAEAGGTPTVTEMTYTEVLTRLGVLLSSLGSDRADFATEHFTAALTIDKDHGPAIAGLGRIKELAGRLDNALIMYKRAAELAPDDFLVSFLYGDALFQKYTDATSNAEKEELVGQARSALRRAAFLRPSFAEAWAKLGYTYTNDPEPDEMGIKAMENAQRLLPKRGDVGYNLTLLYLRSDRLEDARTAIDRMRAAGVDDQMVQAATEMADGYENHQDQMNQLATVPGADTVYVESVPGPSAAERNAFNDRYNEAVALVNAGKTGDAIAALESLIKEAPSENHATNAESLLDQIHDFVSFRDQTDRAVALSNSGDIDGAIEILEPLVDRAADETQAEEVRLFLTKLYGYRDFQAQYNLAVDLVNGGDFNAAVAILEPLIPTAPSPRLGRMAEALLEDLKRMR